MQEHTDFSKSIYTIHFETTATLLRSSIFFYSILNDNYFSE